MRSKWPRSEEHTSELQSLRHLVCRLLLEKKKHITLLTPGHHSAVLLQSQSASEPRLISPTPTGPRLEYRPPATPILFLCPFFFFNDTATTEIYTLSLHDALPICVVIRVAGAGVTLSREGKSGE